MARWSVFPEDAEPPKAALKLAEQVEQDGGAVLTIYREPVGDHWQIFCLLPSDKVDATPYQRDPSPTHVKRLLECVKKVDRFVDPIVVMSPEPGRYWTPNGNHRRIVLEKLKAKMVPAIVVVEAEVAYQILALNKWMKEYAAANHHTYLDYFSAMVDDKGFFKDELSNDGLHPNVQGYAVMNPLAETAIASSLKRRK